MKDLIVFTDIHYGNKRNSLEHNMDCDQFVDWVIEVAKERDIKRGAFLGDWHHNRQSIDVETLFFSVAGMRKLNDYFDEFYFVVGNHDMYYRNSRDVNSLIIGESLDNFIVVDKPTFIEEDSMLFLPWLINDEWKEVRNMKAKYIFGHFELPTFYLNTMITMPDHGELKAEDFSDASYVFSGHFHKRQNQKNVWYIGNAFPHTFDDVDDDERGVMILSDSGIEFKAWHDAPKFRKYRMAELHQNEEKFLSGVSKIHAKILYNSSEYSPMMMNIYREEIKEKYDFRSIEVVDTATTVVIDGDDSEVEETDEEKEDKILEGIDATVIRQIRKQESDEFDIELLVELYKDLG